ncbi:hypothetical protein [Hyphomicrobium sp.]|uniref:hypothetical protein n=1 Tax=Hyphomicrobium sp. TaxID=82 RepID=UPI002BF8E7C7|nr:hypothetical protein [Hyphomicrobium sp.]HRN89313.1 hypothetical protein [Hyphomicrobium sp.]HRQ26352.1 hypothetical protein [Hyphomicrobium sp.]
MSTSLKSERSVLNHEEYQAVLATHHPAIYGLDGKGLHAARVRLRDLRDKERTLARQKRREKRGKAEARGGSFPGTADQPQRRKQIFAAAIKRVNKELDRLNKLEAREANIDAAHRALALKRANKFVHHPASDKTSDEGMNPINNPRRRTKVPPDQIGSVSQRTKAAQARRDARGA